ncbi:hypothetical protein J4E85_007267 [Alternaria conjuncta]|uniref:uncharacterized protein n=1 Tax=Alternaria conjuncta TaxID=181017 RepID=UPI00221ED66B|nr:uncharacterized protein J4E85_007267 [Alternaria conjuncta]KAI4925388.1 hypothetical protein J4E85_007267 [Alternaria conjuncta]
MILQTPQSRKTKDGSLDELPEIKCRQSAITGSSRCKKHAFGTGVNVPSIQLEEWLNDNTISLYEKTRLMRRASKRLGNKFQRKGICGVCGIVERIYKKFNDQQLKSLPSLESLSVPDDFMQWHQDRWSRKPEAQDRWKNLFSVDGMENLQLKFIEKSGVVDGRLQMCEPCYKHLTRMNKRPPRLSLANGTWTGPIPEELRCLTEVEQIVLAPERALQSMFWLKRVNDHRSSCQKASKGHWMSFAQDNDSLARRVRTLPITNKDLSLSIQVNLVDRKGKPDTLQYQLSVDGKKMFRAFQWLKENNPLYEHIEWDEEIAEQYDGSIPECIMIPGGSTSSGTSDEEQSASSPLESTDDDTENTSIAADGEYLDDEAAASINEVEGAYDDDGKQFSGEYLAESEEYYKIDEDPPDVTAPEATNEGGTEHHACITTKSTVVNRTLAGLPTEESVGDGLQQMTGV